ncbi:hypothetical protein [Lentilactobacillus sp. Marseille-Q4993]|uniref:hypothetical protein n=1 Tax=Lentilactobacillus sp. Marseille-Q4993 TaxID=3039492 RepID=UPI0024BCC411|nr:hypothetical protein [Lentilactobacillus sp. Marseille-Q4993]
MSNDKKKHVVNFWVMIIIIILVDALFIGFNSIKKSHNSSAPQITTTKTISNPTLKSLS